MFGVVVCGGTPPHLAELVLLTSCHLCSLSARKLTMSTTSLPTGDTVSPSALDEPTVTGECVHINWCASEAMAVQHVPTLQTVLYCVLSWVVATGGGKVPLLLGPSFSGRLLLVGDMGWMVHWVCRGRQTVCDPPSVSPVLSHCIPCMAEYIKSTSKVN